VRLGGTEPCCIFTPSYNLVPVSWRLPDNLYKFLPCSPALNQWKPCPFKAQATASVVFRLLFFFLIMSMSSTNTLSATFQL
jgi:hypothetical protein